MSFTVVGSHGEVVGSLPQATFMHYEVEGFKQRHQTSYKKLPKTACPGSQEQPRLVRYPFLSSHPCRFLSFFKHFSCHVILLSLYSSQTIRVCYRNIYPQKLLKL